MLSISKLRKNFGTFAALSDVSFEVGAGEIFGFLGPNGAGKTTTISILTGQSKPSSGRIRVGGFDLAKEFNSIKPIFGYVPDFDNHWNELSAEENLRFFCGLYSVKRSRIFEVLRAVELDAERKLSVQHFSKGMKKKLVIAREMLHNPKLLYLDEPTANLDLHSVANIRTRLRDLKSQGTTIFLTTHNMEEAEDLCDRIAIIDRGTIVEIDTPARFKARYGETVLNVVFSTATGDEKRELRLSVDSDKTLIASLIDEGRLLSIHSREFNFKQVFLKLTGREFN